MPTIEDLKKLNEQIAKNDLTARLMDEEAFRLRTAREPLFIQYITEEHIFAETEWTIKTNSSGIALIHLVPFHDKIKVISDLVDYSWFNFDTNIRIEFDESDITILFSEPKQVMPFVKKHRMKLIGTSILDHLSKLKREISSLEEICHTFGLIK